MLQLVRLINLAEHYVPIKVLIRNHKKKKKNRNFLQYERITKIVQAKEKKEVTYCGNFPLNRLFDNHIT